MADVAGRCHERFAAVRDVFENNLDQGADLGASFAVYVDGEPVVDIWGGHVDAERSTPWLEDTIVNVWSTTKVMTAMCALVLSDAGELDLHARVVRYWPEFGTAQKRDVEVRHLLGHTSGLAGWTAPMSVEDLYDWEKATSLLAGEEPWWTPGTASGYHALTQGYLVGELVRRITGQRLGRFFAEQVADPLDADFFIGTPEDADSRVAQVVPPERLARISEDDAPMASRTFLNPLLTAETSWSIPWRRAEVPAANGHGNARSVGAVLSVLACGGEARGVRLLSGAACERVLEEQSNGRDLVLGVPIRFGMGFGLSGGLVSGGPRSCFWGGWGGSIVVADLGTRTCAAFVMNKMSSGLLGDERGASLVKAAFAAVA
jgi:CubicO group peptidase (beta-lactamase class C family)